ncbi:Cytochrome c [Rubripirellula reticaptiva]|uniref:Cytochrome c n=2 Tax=Rubripirellula reticaptiva TaxID=2528013 RepID=A0A5C6FFI3_9BACT|nr:Cytochrome c [Rubripirellula reticaptiva]
MASDADAQTLRHPLAMEEQLKHAGVDYLAGQARLRGDPKRGALVFYKSAAACATCHLESGKSSPLGPNLATLGEVTDQYVIESLLYPSKAIRKGFENHSVITVDGQVLVGMITARDDDSLTMRIASELNRDKVIPMDDVEAMKKSDHSIMPDGLIASLITQRDFLDLARYVMEVAAGGPEKSDNLKPSAEQLAVQDDTKNLDHAGIIKKLGKRDFDEGASIYHGYCFNCHGSDGNTPSLPTARAFGTQKLRFGADPYRMFLTLSHGNGLMAPMSHLTPKERYQVVHYLREQFMKSSNSEYFQVDNDYLAGLPKGTENGTKVADVPRDFGPALRSQLRREISSAMTIPLGGVTISYDLHSMDQAGIWSGGFLDLTQTQHVRDRGEGTASPKGDEIAAAARWQWGHDGTLDYPTDDLLLRGPMPSRWMEYHGHYQSGEAVVLSYSIDGRRILELPRSASTTRVTHSLHLSPGRSLILWVADDFEQVQQSQHDALSVVGNQIALTLRGDTEGAGWSVDGQGRLTLNIPADQQPRNLDIVRAWGKSSQQLAEIVSTHSQELQTPLPQSMTNGGRVVWPEEVKTVGTLGLEKGGYVLDTLTLPDATMSNTWFRTSALDFFSDGRMVVATYGGDVWIVSGVDESLLDLRWKRFAAGLYEPFGLKVVDGEIYVTCKDMITKLHDQDENGEADFYECFSADTDVSVNFHAFNFDLQTDEEGNFYYSKSGHGADSDLPGVVFKISPDGKHREVFSTGFRTPNGMGAIPGDDSNGFRITNSDNQGQWTPASKINVLKKGGFYGWVPTYSIPGMWEPGGGTIDITKVKSPDRFDPPLVWMPQEFDNSSGGQLWVDDPRFGPLSDHLLHTSFGKGWMSYLMIQDVGQTSQAAIIKLPLNFSTGIMRARVNPVDGQVYATGLQGWNGGGRVGLADGGIQRVRYKGTPTPMVIDARVVSGGLELDFNFELDPDSATNVGNYVTSQWDYLWSRNYGSDQYVPGTDRVGTEVLKIESATVQPIKGDSGGWRVRLSTPSIGPVDQLHLVLHLKDINGDAFDEEIYWTINAIPSTE